MLRRHGHALALVGLVAATTVLRAWAALKIAVPWIAPDEMIYGLLGRSLWEHGRLEILGGPTPFYSLLYPALVGLPLRLGGLDGGYDVLRVLQALVLSLTAVPVYLWARSLTRSSWALVAPALVLVLPGLAYAGMLMTEVLFLPLAATAAWLAARALEQPALARQAALLGALLACAATRLEANVLIVAVLVAAFTLRCLRALWPTWAAFAVLALAWLASHRGSPRRALGGYQEAAGSYDVGRALRFVAYHAGDLVLAAGVLPVCAAALLVLVRPAEARLRAQLAITWALALVTVCEVGVFASNNADRLTERTMLLAIPPFCVSFAVWLDRGLPRPRWATAITAVLVGVAAAALPLGRLATEEAVQDNPTLVAAIRLLRDHGVSAVRIGLVVVVVAALLLFTLLPRRLALVLPVLTVAGLAAASVAASREFVDQSRLRSARLYGDDPTLVERQARGPAAYVYEGDPYWNTVWAQLWRNPRIETVYHFVGAPVPGPLPQRELMIFRPDGVLRPIDGRPMRERYLLAPQRVGFAGTVLGRTVVAGSSSGTLELTRVDGRPELSTLAAGLQPNGDIFDRATLTAFRCAAGTFGVTLLGKSDQNPTVRLDRTLVARPHLTNEEPWSADIPSPPGGGTNRACVLEVVSNGVVGTTRLEFVRGS